MLVSLLSFVAAVAASNVVDPLLDVALAAATIVVACVGGWLGHRAQNRVFVILIPKPTDRCALEQKTSFYVAHVPSCVGLAHYRGME